MEAPQQAVDATRVAWLILDGSQGCSQNLEATRQTGHEVTRGAREPGLLVLCGRRPDHGLGRTTSHVGGPNFRALAVQCCAKTSRKALPAAWQPRTPPTSRVQRPSSSTATALRSMRSASAG